MEGVWRGWRGGVHGRARWCGHLGRSDSSRAQCRRQQQRAQDVAAGVRPLAHPANAWPLPSPGVCAVWPQATKTRAGARSSTSPRFARSSRSGWGWWETWVGCLGSGRAWEGCQPRGHAQSDGGASIRRHAAHTQRPPPWQYPAQCPALLPGTCRPLAGAPLAPLSRPRSAPRRAAARAPLAPQARPPTPAPRCSSWWAASQTWWCSQGTSRWVAACMHASSHFPTCSIDAGWLAGLLGGWLVGWLAGCGLAGAPACRAAAAARPCCSPSLTAGTALYHPYTTRYYPTWHAVCRRPPQRRFLRRILRRD